MQTGPKQMTTRLPQATRPKVRLARPRGGGDGGYGSETNRGAGRMTLECLIEAAGAAAATANAASRFNERNA